MARTLQTAIPHRIVAAIVALGLSGVPAIAAERWSAGRVATHRCQCPPGEHDCHCPVCRSAARHARRAALAELPQCHRAQALAALAREEAEDDRRSAGAAPCLRSACDGPEETLQSPAAHDPFVPPPPALLGHGGLMSPLPDLTGASLSRAREPDVPPPRRA